MRSAIAIITLLLATGGAMAYCPSVPDNAGSHYVANQANRTLCLQQELAASTAAAQQQVQVDTALRNLDRLVLQQRMEALSRPAPLFPGVTTPGFP